MRKRKEGELGGEEITEKNLIFDKKKKGREGLG